MAQVEKEITVESIIDCEECEAANLIIEADPAQLVGTSPFFIPDTIEECCPTHQFNKDCCQKVISKTRTGTFLRITFDDAILEAGVTPEDLTIEGICCLNICDRYLKELIDALDVRVTALEGP